LNYFLPTVKLIDKTRVEAKVRKVYDRPQSPANGCGLPLASAMMPRWN
jgi:hypothetical protein